MRPESGAETRRPLRLLHLITTLDPGGTERLLLCLARSQRQSGCSVDVAVLRGEAPLAARFEAEGIPVHRLSLDRTLSLAVFWRLRGLIRNGGYDVLHTHLDLADLYGPFAARGTKGPVVISTRHNTDPWRARRTWKRPAFLVWERAAQRRTAATVAVSAAVRDFLVRVEGLDRGRFVVIENGIDLGPFAVLPAREEARALLARHLGGHEPACIPIDRPLAGFVGRLAPQKGVDLLLEAAALSRCRPSIVLIGSGPLETTLRERARRADLRDRILFAGELEPAARLLPALDMFVFPSRWEGFGLAASEAMAAGLPVIATRVDGLASLIEDGISGRLVPPGDVAALAAAIDELAENPDLARRLGATARRTAFARFDARRMVLETEALYRRLLAARTPARPKTRWMGRGRVDAGSLGATPASGGSPWPLDAETNRLLTRQVRSMWAGVLPEAMLRGDPGRFLREQEAEYRAVADDLETNLPLAGRRLLDLGCGPGSMLIESARRGAFAVGIEPDGASLALSRHRLRATGNGGGDGEPPGALAAADGEALPFVDASMDIVTCCSVLEHVKDPAAVLREVRRVLRPGGWLYLGVPNALHFQERHYKIFLPPRTPRAVARAWLRLRGRNPDFLDTVHEMTPRRALELVRGAGLEIVVSPIQRRMARLEATLSGVERPARRRGRVAVALARATGSGALLRTLVRRGFLVTGAILARRPSGESRG